MSFYESTDATQPGQYDVAVSQAAAQATDTGTVIAGGAVSTPETLAITSGGTVPATASYTTTAGESLTAIAAGLNQAFATNNVTVNASVVNGALTLTSQAYGAAASFTVTSTASGAGTTGLTAVANEAQDFAGTDVEGTINGQAATGTGQLLLGTSGTAAQGMLVLVSATAAQLAAAGGSTSATVSYRPGIAQALANVAYAAGNPDNGTLVNSIAGEQSDMSHLSTEISAWNPILQQQEVHLTDEYTAMETTLSTLKTTQSYLTQFMASSSSSSSSS
jgi:flagellar hook-associated protein 2